MPRRWFLWLVVAFPACNRVEEPASSAEAPSAPAGTTATPVAPVSSAPATPTCIAPSPAEPPPPASPAKSCPPDPGPVLELARGALRFLGAPNAPRLKLEIARTDAERARGLMYRTELPEDHGMLFSWPSEGRRTFWMRDTCIPLDMLFLDEAGGIVGIVEQVPVLNDLGRSVPCPAAHVLEVNAGFCRKYGVKTGTYVAFE